MLCLYPLRNTWVASSAVEHSAFNRLVLGSNPRRPIFIKTPFSRGFDVLGDVFRNLSSNEIMLAFYYAACIRSTDKGL
jgi:hypothetical protein